MTTTEDRIAYLEVSLRQELLPSGRVNALLTELLTIARELPRERRRSWKREEELYGKLRLAEGLIKPLKAERHDLITVAMAAEYALEYPDDNPVIAALQDYENKWGELPAGPKPDEVNDILLAALERFRRAQEKGS